MAEAGIGRRLKAAIERSGKSKNSVMAAAGIGQAHLYKILRDDVVPQVDTFAAICRAADLDANEILGLSPEESEREPTEGVPRDAPVVKAGNWLMGLRPPVRRAVYLWVEAWLSSKEADADSPDWIEIRDKKALVRSPGK